MPSQHDAPLMAALARCAARPQAAFYTPGHKRGQGISSWHRRVLGQKAFQADLPELPELDNLFAPTTVIQQAQTLAAEAFGAQQTWFLANGSTCGLEAALLAVCNPGDKVIVPRNAHRSVISGLVLGGAMPVYVMPEYRADWGIPLAVSASAIATTLAQHPDTRAVLVVSPTYEGICADIDAIARCCHAHGVPLIVDEAHGPHFAFHRELPQPALALGADLVVQSAHKVLSALTQAALLHRGSDRIDGARLAQALQLTQSTSPSYLLLASLDAARHQMATDGPKLMSQTLALAESAAAQLSTLSGIDVLTGQPLAQGQRWDQTRLTISVAGLGLTGWAADEFLHERGVTAELPAAQTLTFIISLGNTAADIDQLVAGCQQLCQLRSQTPTPQWSTLQFSPAELSCSVAVPAQSPRTAFFAPTQSCPWEAAVGRLSADTICPYPPGIPTLIAGEVITATALAQLKHHQAAGAHLTGQSDPQLQQLRVLVD
ncbi:MAG: aminotransferase class I/II-fold pyridoxal phosphate-dependent enzyme [Cyanobacteria bacterium J06632_22]